MHSNHSVTAADMSLLPNVLKYTAPQQIPLQFKLGDRLIKGIPNEFKPTVTYRILSCNMVQYIIEGENQDGLSIRAEYLEYRDFLVEFPIWSIC